MGDFFACGWGQYCQINSLAVCVNPELASNCYWAMPFHKKSASPWRTWMTAT